MTRRNEVPVLRYKPPLWRSEPLARKEQADRQSAMYEKYLDQYGKAAQ
ncbi:hypothetical protein L917_08491 [Phytophthora nicotianae]|uniref:Uncharacterized protein n=1 Tax=Phytophthora nicotianae TaxID=4792 RepID=W2J1E0_PHYNI|nr:hypothetical protein L915_08659 [Phytophthora nicotianae]ETL40181.1 hypothetical protein L916_08588 [Phytophthora nicotianae]ETL93324.1 hypothetical protein L917_08491 [Phytophthora nicotianae]